MDTVRLDYPGIEIEIAVPDDGPPSLWSVDAGGLVARFDGPPVPLVEILTVGDGHVLPVQRVSGTLVGERLRYVTHHPIQHGWALELEDPQSGLTATLALISRAPATLSATTTVINASAARQVVTAVTSVSVPATAGALLGVAGVGDTGSGETATTARALSGETATTGWALPGEATTGRALPSEPAATGALPGGPSGALGRTTVFSARGEWTGENRWRAEAAADLLVDLRLGPGATRKSAHRWVSTGSWSTADASPVGAVVDETGWALGWQIEHNGAWRSELAELQGALRATLSGPTDVDHGWLGVLGPGAAFTTVPVTLAFGADLEQVVGALTGHRRAARRPHPDNAVPTLVYNDYMNTLMGDPSTAKLMPLIEQAGRAGAEAFCIDAGWYDDSSGWWDSVGAWQPSGTRFPGGLDEVLHAIRDRGMVPGLWLEPEVVGIRSPIAETLPPEAFFQRAGVRIREAGRYHLDLRHPAARAHLDEVVDRLVGRHGVGYFKFDYNINPGAGTDRAADSVGAGLLGHNRAHLAWLDAVLDRHPDLIIENCGSGAMRMDFAMLSRLQLQSTTDQEDPRAYAPIAVAAPMTVLPEQAGSWAYPSAEMDDEETAYVLSLGLLGRLYLSGFLDRLRPTQRELVAEAVTTYKSIRGSIPHRVPTWPTGLPGWTDPWLSLGLRGSADTLVTVFRRDDASPQVALSLPAYAAGELVVEPLFPVGLPSWETAWDPDSGTLWVLAGSESGTGLAARTLRLSPQR